MAQPEQNGAVADVPSSQFSTGEVAWGERLGLARDAVRQELVSRQLHAHLPPLIAGEDVPRVLDVGCGQGTQAILLARAGYEVVGWDPAPALLDQARAALTAEPLDVQGRVLIRHGDLDAVRDRIDAQFDIVCCHGVVMYLPSLDEAVVSLVSALRPGGVMSLLTRNRAGIAMRAGMMGDWRGALRGFEAHHYTNRLGVEDVRADDPEDVVAALGTAGIRTVAWYGVRLFTDHWDDVSPPSDFGNVVAAEEEAGRRDPYRRLAALTHTIGVRAE